MKIHFTTGCCLAVFSLCIASNKLLADTTYIKFGSEWKYLDKGKPAPARWSRLSFNDASWKTGPAEFGYGANRERTLVSYGPDAVAKYITTYFRRTITIPNTAAYNIIRLNAYIDDGAIFYVNGKEVARINITGKPADTTLATPAADNGNALATFDIPVSNFVNGKNIIAAEVHQSEANSPDLAFDLEMIATPAIANGSNAEAAEPAITRGPLLQMVNAGAVTVRWTTAAANSSRIKYGNDENALTREITDAHLVTEHEMRITGLLPDTKYYYAIGSQQSILKGSYRNYFTTSPPADTKRKIRIGVFGDPGTGNAMQKSTRDNYLKIKGGYNNAEMVIMLGDNAYSNGTEAEHNTKFFDIYNNNVFDNNVVFPVPGNHEYANNRARAIDHDIPYYHVFSVPANGECGGLPSGTEHYYSYDYGNIHFIMLDSYGIDGGSRLYEDTANGPQAVWLKADLDANAGKHKWTIVCLHHPPYTNGSHISDTEQDLVAIRQKITPILERYGVDVVLAGHSHVYERSFLVKDHVGRSGAFNNAAIPGGGTAISLSNARYDGSTGNKASADTSAATSSCPYFTIDSVYKHGTVYVVAGSAGQINANGANTYPVFYTRNQAKSTGGETGALYLEIQDNRLDARFVGSSGTVRDQFTIMKGVNKKTVVNTTVNTAANLTASWIGGYNWYTVPATTTATTRALAVTPTAAGTFIYYVNDSLAPKTTCIADTFQLQVTSTLAVSVINYNATLKNKKVYADWTTTQEVNSDYFTIERSANGRDYEMAMIISGKGNSNTPTNYQFIDNDPLPGTSYYRLMATDKDGDKKIAGIITVTNNAGKSFGVNLRPSPAINTEFNTAAKYERTNGSKPVNSY